MEYEDKIEARRARYAARAERKRAETYGTHGISSDDPGAVEKLEAKLAELEAKRTAYKDHNKRARKEGKDPLPRYVLTNLGANIRRVKGRIAELEKAAERPAAEPITGDGWTIEECPADNRLRVIFDEKPPRETWRLMRRYGFRWAPSVGAWQRHLNDGARYAAQCVARELGGAS
jgi:hypothetical protein